MKIACITDDGRTISPHFGRAQYYVVATIEEGQVTAKEMRDKLGHQHFSAEEQGHESAAGHGTDPTSHDRHSQMAEAIADCQVLLCRGMGRGAYLSMQQFDITPMVTDVTDIDQALQTYLDGQLQDHPELLH